eukprot:CAMPEP_0202889562 /NCGR_PEP_ID=MMETSP1392-20130828/148_1 /ASSEMBLY_ACC=CAM_ASM_000868 /TAXON_ID=225041 /ORGANISM="Chlamydomonas chlamydogama, Strain SAG 11-48b" /LENGTH=630 /DNA_ID=CAMNT_0049572921 /DNA_START=41 /DNA_END=1930 /DNA_ORIENTATION=+
MGSTCKCSLKLMTAVVVTIASIQSVTSVNGIIPGSWSKNLSAAATVGDFVTILKNAHEQAPVSSLIFSPVHSGSSLSSLPTAAHMTYNAEVKRTTLPRLGIVITVTPSSSSERPSSSLRHYFKQLSVLNCYSAMYGIHMHTEFWNPMKDGAINGRMRYVQKYLPMYQWVLMLDVDTVPLRWDRCVTTVLDDRYDVILQEAENGRLHPSFFVKNSLYGMNWVLEQLRISDGSVGTDISLDLQVQLLQRIKEQFPDSAVGIDKALQLSSAGLKSDFFPLFVDVVERNRDRLRRVKVNRVGWGHVRTYTANPSERAAGHGPEVFRLEHDIFGHGQRLWQELTERELLCQQIPGGQARPDRVLNIDAFRRLAKSHKSYVWHPLCWSEQQNLCDASMNGKRPMDKVVQLGVSTQPYIPLANVPVAHKKVFIDLGARGGDSAKLFLQKFPSADMYEVHAFEADKKFTASTFEALAAEFKVKIVFFSGAAWMKDVENMAFGVYDHASSVFKTSYNDLTGLEGTENKNVLKCRAYDMAKYLSSHFRHEDFVMVKMDIELSEFPVLLHLINTGTITLIDVLLLECHSVELTSLDKDVTEDTCMMLSEQVARYGVEVIRWNTGKDISDWSSRNNDFRDLW